MRGTLTGMIRLPTSIVALTFRSTRTQGFPSGCKLRRCEPLRRLALPLGVVVIHEIAPVRLIFFSSVAWSKNSVSLGSGLGSAGPFVR